jgi:Uma2 family endonuclease
MPSAYKILPHYTYEDYCRWEGKWELIDGIPHAMSPLPGLRHQDVSGNLYMLFRQALQQRGCSCKVFLPLDYKISDDTVVQPDLLIVCNPELKETRLEKPPVLVAEILSPSTALKDRNTKFHLYQSEKVPYYIIVDADKNEIEIYKMGNEGYKLVNSNSSGPFTFQLTPECSIDIQLKEIWS